MDDTNSLIKSHITLKRFPNWHDTSDVLDPHNLLTDLKTWFYAKQSLVLEPRHRHQLECPIFGSRARLCIHECPLFGFMRTRTRDYLSYVRSFIFIKCPWSALFILYKNRWVGGYKILHIVIKIDYNDWQMHRMFT